MLDGIWSELTTNVSLGEDPDPNITGNVLTFGSGRARYVYPATNDTFGIAQRVWLTNIPDNNTNRPGIAQFRDVSNNVQVVVLVSPTGSLQVYRNTDPTSGAGTLIGETSGPVMVAQSWRHIEIWATRHASAGTVTIRIEGVEVLALENVNTGNATYAQVAVGTSFSLQTVSIVTYVKDVVFLNGAGSQNNTFIGPCGVYRLTPNGDVSSGWSRTSGSSDYELVNEAPPNDSGYIYAGDPPPAPSIMTLTNLPADIIAVRGLVPTYRVQKSDGGDGSIQTSVSPNGTDWDDGADNAPSTAFSYFYDVSEVSPDTTSPWTPTEVNSAEIKLNRTA
jgi:hypothetical protein